MISDKDLDAALVSWFRDVHMSEIEASEDGSQIATPLPSDDDDSISINLTTLARALASALTLHQDSQSTVRALRNFSVRVRGIMSDYRELPPEEDETWESWFFAAFDLAGSKIGEALDKAIREVTAGQTPIAARFADDAKPAASLQQCPTREQIKRAPISIPQEDLATASDDYLLGFTNGALAELDAILALTPEPGDRPQLIEMLRVCGANLETAAFVLDRRGDPEHATVMRKAAAQILPLLDGPALLAEKQEGKP
jgi:hypothetical protein